MARNGTSRQLAAGGNNSTKPVQVPAPVAAVSGGAGNLQEKENVVDRQQDIGPEYDARGISCQAPLLVDQDMNTGMTVMAALALKKATSPPDWRTALRMGFSSRADPRMR